MTSQEGKYELYRTAHEDQIRKEFANHFRNCPMPGDEILANLGLFISSKNLSRILFMHHLYQQIIDVQGIIIEFGTRWGQNLALFSALRGIYEPFNRHRKIVGFDTFTGFPGTGEKDRRSHELIKKGGFATTENYVEYLTKVLEYHEQDNPLRHLRKFELRVGDAIIEIDKYLGEYPETIVALAYFDLDIYEPTKKCLQAIRPHLVKGSVLGFDELNDSDSPGETLALREVFGLNNIKLKRYRYASRVSYFVLE
ncbi:MAG: crotonobetainyl-CoA--carnitine CoA-transferase [Dehalococcoidia bacterium]